MNWHRCADLIRLLKKAKYNDEYFSMGKVISVLNIHAMIRREIVKRRNRKPYHKAYRLTI